MAFLFQDTVAAECIACTHGLNIVGAAASLGSYAYV